MNAHREKVHEDWRARHPALAKEERALKRARIEREEQFGHKVNGTIATHAQASVVRQGGLMRLYRSGGITIHQWGASLEIAAAHARVVLDAGLPSSWALERVDHSPDPETKFQEALGTVRMELTYSRWRRALPTPGPVLAMIVEDCGLVAAARRYSMHERRARRLLREALSSWIDLQRKVRDDVNEATLAAAQEGIF